MEERNDGAVEARRRGSYTNWLTATYHDWFLLWSERERLFGPDPGQLTPEQETELAAATRHKQAVSTSGYITSSPYSSFLRISIPSATQELVSQQS